MNERGLVEVPENAIRDEPIAFGLTGVQLAICGAGVLVAAVVNLLPVWEIFRVVLVLLLAGPVFVAGALPVRGEPAYRWLIRAIRYLRGRRVWAAALTVAANPQLIDEEENAPADADRAPGDRQDVQLPDSASVAEDGIEQGRRSVASGAREPPVEHEPVRLRIVQPDIDDANASSATGLEDASPRPPVVPHVLPGLRVACLLSFVGGTGRTTLAVEIASLVARWARYRTMDGEERPVRVLLVDANRLASAVGLRLGLSADALSSAWLPRFWLEPGSVAELAVESRAGPSVLTLPPHHQLTVSELRPPTEPPPEFSALAAKAIVRGAEEAGFQLVVADLASTLEEGHRELIDQADVVVGVVRPTAESVAEPFRLAEVVRHMDAGRKLALVASMAEDEEPVRRWAAEAGLPFAGRVGRHAAFDAAALRGEPAWPTDPAVEAEVTEVARIAWPLLGSAPQRRDGVLAALRGGRR